MGCKSALPAISWTAPQALSPPPCTHSNCRGLKQLSRFNPFKQTPLIIHFYFHHLLRPNSQFFSNSISVYYLSIRQPLLRHIQLHSIIYQLHQIPIPSNNNHFFFTLFC